IILRDRPTLKLQSPVQKVPQLGRYRGFLPGRAALLEGIGDAARPRQLSSLGEPAYDVKPGHEFGPRIFRGAAQRGITGGQSREDFPGSRAIRLAAPRQIEEVVYHREGKTQPAQPLQFQLEIDDAMRNPFRAGAGLPDPPQAMLRPLP